jgi:hypothetical protein
MRSFIPPEISRTRFVGAQQTKLNSTSAAEAFAFRPPDVAVDELAEKLKTLSFRGTLRAEESLFFRALKPRGIPHFVRNDNQRGNFRSL